jgi:polyphenol oxidase
MVTYDFFKPFAELLAFTTTKEDFPHILPRITGTEQDRYMSARTKLADLLGLDSSQLVFPDQTHSSHIGSVAEDNRLTFDDTDALVTSRKNICLCVQTADCVPVLVYDSNKKVIAAIHAGWKGTLNRITAKTIEKMRLEFSCNPDDLNAVIGPSIGPERYETGLEVADLFKSHFDNWPEFLVLQNNRRYHIDLWNANHYQLKQQGIPAGHIQVLQECTYLRHNKYFSARREGSDTGRMVSGIMIRQ